jgi:tripartite-type tricarboxylate transporter receptor subunit TctC
MINRSAVIILMSVSLIVPVRNSQAQNYPDHTARIIVPQGAGGQTDLLTRVIAQELSSSLHQSFVVENRTGAGGNIGAQFVANSSPDGYTLLAISSAIISVNPILYPGASFDAAVDLKTFDVFCTTPFVLVVNSKSSLDNVKSLVASSKEKQLTFGSGGRGTIQDLSAELFKYHAKLDAVHVPFRGGAESEAAILGGQVDFMFDSILGASPFIKNGDFRALGLTGSSRSSLLPSVPTMAESGYAGVDAMVWIGFAVPAATPPAVIELLTKEINRIVGLPQIKAKFVEAGVDPVNWGYDEIQSIIKSDTQKWKEVLKNADIK